MNINIGLKKEEALKRLNILKSMGMTYTPAIECFKKGKDIGLFERQNAIFNAIYYQVNLNTGDNGFYDMLRAKINEFENEHNAIVYLITKEYTEFGVVCDFFYVSDYENDWEFDKQDLKKNESYVYTWNIDDDILSEVGRIGFEVSKLFGGIYRSA